MNRTLAAILSMTCLLSPALFGSEQAAITVGDRVVNPITRFMAGACLEDVNHEVYGGIYSQMLYGESFQEPVPPPTFAQFDVYGGQWTFADGSLAVAADRGAKLVARDVRLGDGRVDLDIRLPQSQDGFAGLILKVTEPAAGADAFIGYEVSLNPARQVLRLGRHRNNWEHISDTPCSVPADRWTHLSVSCAGAVLEVRVDDKSVVRYEDAEHPLEPGSVGLRTWDVQAQFRDLKVTQDGRETALSLKPQENQPQISGMWRPVRRGSAQGTWSIETSESFKGDQSQRLTFASGRGEIGVENQGLNRWGLYIQADKEYEGVVWARTEKAMSMVAALESGDGAKIYVEKNLTLRSGGWQRLEFALTPRVTDKNARFAVKLAEPGSVVLGYAFLQPGPWGRFKNLPVRRDVAEALIAQGLTVLRYGGCMVNTDAYRWKNMIGPRDRRPPYKGFWFPYSSNGWGIVDFMDFCRAAGFLCIPAFNMGETPQDMADFVEYANGPAASEWGQRRAQDGRPEPYRLRYIQLGNEESVDEDYWQKFEPMAEAIWEKDPNITIVVGDFAYDKPIRDPYNFEGAPRIKSLAIQKKILDLAARHNREVWFDVHIWTDKPADPDGLGGVPSFIQALRQISPQAKFKVAVFELNAGNHALRRALSNAHAINELERLGADVPVVCSANCLQPYRQNENGWDQGLLFLDPSQVWAQPPYYVTQMVSSNYLPLRLETTVQCPDQTLDVTATRSEDGGAVALSVVNIAAQPVETRIEFQGRPIQGGTAAVTTLTGGLEEINTPEEPMRIVPTKTRQTLSKDASGRQFAYTFPAHSFTILRWE
ncbi:MAG: alpha-L-arabinofuranosidase C-terminal domain-containing protein [Phycisphaerales bacterium]